MKVFITLHGIFFLLGSVLTIIDTTYTLVPSFHKEQLIFFTLSKRVTKKYQLKKKRFIFPYFPRRTQEGSGGEQRRGLEENCKILKNMGSRDLLTRAKFKNFLDIGICPKPVPKRCLRVTEKLICTNLSPRFKHVSIDSSCNFCVSIE